MRFVESEPVNMSEDPLRDGRRPGRDPFKADQAFRVFTVTSSASLRCFPQLDLVQVEWLSLFAHPLSGVRPWSAIPAGMVSELLRVEAALAPLAGTAPAAPPADV